MPHRPPHPPRRRLLTVLALLVGLAATLVPATPPAPAGATAGPVPAYANEADAAAAWLVGRFEANGASWSAAEHADLIFALAATNGSRTVAIESLQLMEAVTPTYIAPSPTSFNVGGTAKVMLAVQTLGGDVNDFAGYDLEEELRSRVVASGADEGRVGNATTFTQPLIIMALDRTPGGAPASTSAWLAGRQCPSGGFSFGNCNFADADHTGLAAGALLSVGATAPAEAALDWLEDHQSTDDGFHASNSPNDSNTNSTGLAVQALRAAGRTTSVAGGAAYVAAVQLTAGDNAGAIPWKAGTNGSLFLATTQGVLAWGAPTYAELAFPTVVGEPCPPARGVTVVVDLAHFDDTIRIGCAEGAHANGTSAMEAAGFTIGWHPDYPGGGPGLGGAVCQLEGQPVEGYPTCWYIGFWSYWHAQADAQWEFSGCGIDNRTPRQGSVEGWRYEPDVNNHMAAAPLVDARFPRVTLEAPEDVVPVGQPTTLTATVEATAARVAPGPGDPPVPCYLPPETEPEHYEPTITGPVTRGLVELRVDGEPTGAPLPVSSEGRVTAEVILPAGDHEVTAHYLGDARALPSPSTPATVVVAAPTATVLDVDPATVEVGQDVTLTATVTEAGGGAPVADGEVELRADGVALADPVPVTDGGTAVLPTSFATTGTRQLTAHYLGGTAALPSESVAVPLEVTEATGPVDPTEELVRRLYRAVLEREPDAAGLAHWVGRLEAGTPPARLAETLARTREGWTKVVQHHYRLALNRGADAPGTTFWTDTLVRTNRPDELLTRLFASPEVYTRSGSTSAGYVTYLYQRVLNRAPDQAGLDHWTRRLDTAPGSPIAARQSAARALVFTAEAIRRQVDAGHRQVCDGPTPAGARPALTEAFRASHLNPSVLRAAVVIQGCPA